MPSFTSSLANVIYMSHSETFLTSVPWVASWFRPSPLPTLLLWPNAPLSHTVENM